MLKVDLRPINDPVEYFRFDVTCAVAGQHDVDSTVLRPSFRCVVRRHWVGFPERVGRDEIRLHAMRDEVVRDADGPFGRQVEVLETPFALSPSPIGSLSV